MLAQKEAVVLEESQKELTFAEGLEKEGLWYWVRSGFCFRWDRTFRDCHWLDSAPCYVVQAGSGGRKEKDFPDHRREQIESLHDPVSSRTCLSGSNGLLKRRKLKDYMNK